MKSVSKDARGFVEGIVSHIRRSGKGGVMAPKVQSLLMKMTQGARREHQATVESAVKLTSVEQQTIARVLSGIAGCEVGISSVVTPSLIGGLRITMADWVMDMSIKNELRKMASLVAS